jgi:hypothetical protein
LRGRLPIRSDGNARIESVLVMYLLLERCVVLHL